jgi:hypothetical protein
MKGMAPFNELGLDCDQVPSSLARDHDVSSPPAILELSTEALNSPRLPGISEVPYKLSNQIVFGFVHGLLVDARHCIPTAAGVRDIWHKRTGSLDKRFWRNRSQINSTYGVLRSQIIIPL